MSPDCNPIEQQARQDQLDAWYKEDGRDDEAHPDHATYTGLAEKYGQAPACTADVCPCTLEGK